MMVALAVAANWMSFSLIPPTPRCTKASWTSSRSSRRRPSVTASREPWTSALTIRLRVAASPRWICSKMSSKRAPPERACESRPMLAWRRQWLRFSATRPASFSLGATTKATPGSATSSRPSNWTGVDGPASSTEMPWSSIRARARPHEAPATTGSPTRRVPCWTSTVATGPLPMSRFDSRTTPRARSVGSARRSSISATTPRLTSSSSIPVFSSAETSTVTVSPPQASGTSSFSASWLSTLWGSAFSRSTLLIATTIGTSATRAWLMASTVWGMTPSSAATTRTTMSVESAPRARIEVNASWPGVSMKVSRWPSRSTW